MYGEWRASPPKAVGQPYVKARSARFNPLATMFCNASPKHIWRLLGAPEYCVYFQL